MCARILKFSLLFAFAFFCFFFIFSLFSKSFAIALLSFLIIGILGFLIRVIDYIHFVVDQLVLFKDYNYPVDANVFYKCRHLVDFARHYDSQKNLILNLITETKQLRGEQSNLLEHLDHGVLILDEEKKMLKCNKQMSRLLKADTGELVGKSLEDFYDPLLEKCEKLITDAKELKTVQTLVFEYGENNKTHLEIAAFPIPYIKEIILIIKDLSCHFKVKEIGKDFIANASHELRTPITIIKGFTETLRDLPEISGAMLEDILEKVLRNCERMDVLVKNLLLLADLDYLPRTRLIPCDPFSLLDNCLDYILSIYPECHIAISPKEEGVKILADPELLELAIINLLQNAVKYSPGSAQISIEVKKQEKNISLSIADRGIGIPEHELDRIFERFHTVDKAHSRRLGGAGLGLSIVKNIIDKHEGSIDVSSEVGKGTTFTLILSRI